jgi:DNA-binding transcriptional ArsR family regulator
MSMESAFAIIAEPNRRAILSLLLENEQPVGEIERRLHMAQPMVSKHLRVLRDAGFVESTVDAQRRLYRLRPEPFHEVDTWLEQFRRFWERHVDALERHLERMERVPGEDGRGSGKSDGRGGQRSAGARRQPKQTKAQQQRKGSAREIASTEKISRRGKR